MRAARIPCLSVSNCSKLPSVFLSNGYLPSHGVPDIRKLSGLLLRSPRGRCADVGAIVSKFIVNAE